MTPNCARCGCSNTKFCYYNNYSLTQPRYFCKGCRRYWTKGGSLRNVPVGGGCRKNRRGSKSLRLCTTTIEGHVHHNSNKSSTALGSSYGSVHNSYGTNVVINKSLADSTTASVTQDRSSIDLAVVYANFLNQKPDNSNSTGSDHQLPELPFEFDPATLDFSTMALNMNTASSGNNRNIQFLEDHHQNGPIGSLGCHTNLSTENCSTNDLMYCGGLDPLIHQDKHHQIQDRSDHVQLFASTHYASDFGLPPLPGQEAFWSTASQMLVTSSHTMQSATPLLGPEAHDPNLIIGSWSPVDLPCSETFSRST